MISTETINPQVLAFLVQLSEDSKTRLRLSYCTKNSVLNTAKEYGYDFTEMEYDKTLFGFEAQIAENIGENFTDPTFSLWNLMWGKTYLDYLLDGVVPILKLLSSKHNLL